MSLSLRSIATSSRFACAAAMLGLAASACSQTPNAVPVAPQLLPYTSKLIAGGATGATFTVGTTCPQAGAPNMAKDTFGDGCLANEIVWGTGTTGPRYAIADSAGNVFIADYTNGLVRRVDAITGIITAVAGGATSNPAKNAACGAYTSTDILGDGCLGTAVKLGRPAGMAFDAAGDLIFADSYNYNIRKIAATGGFVPATGGVISLVAGDVGGTVSTGGYTSGVVAATSSYVEDVYGIAMDLSGNLFYADEYTKAEDVSVINTNSTSDVVTGVTVPAGDTVKIAGATANGGPCINSPTTGFGCTYGTFAPTYSGLATSTQLDAPYAVGIDNKGNVFIANEYENSVAKINSSGTLTNYAGLDTGAGSKTVTNTTRQLATTIAMGSDFGIAADNNSNIYITDALLGFVWRVDATTGFGYVVAGGGSGTCTNPNSLDTPAAYDTGDTFGDGCPGLQAKLGAGTGTTYATSGVFGITVDKYADIFIGDDVTNVVREIASGTQFGVVGANQPTDIVEIHFAPGDTPSTTTPYTLTTGATNFSLGNATCTYNNADATTDCLLPVTATPTVLGPFTGTLQVTSALGGVGTFPLSGDYVQSPVTRTSLSYTAAATCTGTTTYSTTTPITLTAVVSANGPTPPTGSADTVTFYAKNGTNTTTLGTMQVTNTGSSSSPVYSATLTYTFSTVGTYTLSAVFSGDTYYHTSTGTAAKTITTSLPGFSIAPVSYMESSVVPGQTALYSFTVAQNVYTGTVSFAVQVVNNATNQPAQYVTAVLSPTTLTGAGCSVTNTVALSIITQQQTVVQPGSFGGTGHGPWQIVTMLTGLGLALLVGLRRRSLSAGLRHAAMAFALLLIATGTVACGKAVGTIIQPATPTGSYTVTVTPSATVGTAPAAITFPLTVHN